jgi:hypothetical protein
MRPVETIPGIGGGDWDKGGIKENDGGINSTIIYSIYCKNFYKWYNVPSAQQ